MCLRLKCSRWGRNARLPSNSQPLDESRLCRRILEIIPSNAHLFILTHSDPRPRSPLLPGRSLLNATYVRNRLRNYIISMMMIRSEFTLGESVARHHVRVVAIILRSIFKWRPHRGLLAVDFYWWRCLSKGDERLRSRHVGVEFNHITFVPVL